tara:strand:- start:253 stop:417 length:165 start_codon:yes stop_codon:yes gene_type:complete
MTLITPSSLRSPDKIQYWSLYGFAPISEMDPSTSNKSGLPESIQGEKFDNSKFR